jgi:hypothetical protein
MKNNKKSLPQEEKPSMGFCLVSNMITMEGKKVGYMYREELEENSENDSGWRFLAGSENQQYVDNDSNSKVYEVETIADFDSAIIPYLKSPFGTELERIEGKDEFRILD